ncbi:fructoselysine 6-kinase [Mesobacillus foraminis]|uniref:fructoselysine 6-kinase n=1 Tax=Mesobacillus foraminis TaxID=279826 RepID=UPI00399FD256
MAAIGDNCFDIYPKLKKSYPTGNAVDFAVHLQRLGVPTSLISYTGNDLYGSKMIEAIRKEHIDISHLHVVEGPTALTCMDLSGTERIHGDYIEGVLENMKFSKEDIDFAGGHSLVHTAFWGKAEQDLEKLRSKGAKISFDYATKLDHPMVVTTLPFVDYAFFSYQESKESFDKEYLVEAVGKGPKIAVATFGKEGSFAYDGKRFYEFGSFKARVVNTVGAGDAFIAGFILGILMGRPIEKCLEKGAEIAAKVVEVFEAWD